MSEKIIIHKWLSLLLVLALLWLGIGCFLVFQFWPDLPHTKLQWFLFIVFGPPIYIVGEAFFGRVFSPKHGQAISQREFSLVRVLLALPIALAFFALSWWLAQ
jgi:membrane protein implicated in regulation of membrane protease activity